MTRQRWRTWGTIALGMAVSVLFVWLAARQVEGRDVVAAFAGANYLYVGLSALAIMAGLVLRAIRWRLIASAPLATQPSYIRAANIGALANMILPARAGEFIRIYTLARLTGSRLLNPVVSSVLDRLVDVGVLFAATLGLYLFLPRDANVDAWLHTIVIVSAAVLAVMVLVALLMGKGHAWLTLFTERWLANWRLRPDVFYAELRDETRHLLGGWFSLRLLGVVALIALLDCLVLAVLLVAFHLHLPIIATILLWVFLTVGSMLPSAPGYIGVYQTAAIWALSVFSVPASSAVAVAIVLQAATLVVTFAVTGPGFWRLLKSALAAQKTKEQ